MVLTVTLNPSIDKTLLVDALVPGGEARVLAASETAGGKGLNAARALNALGVEVRAAGISPVRMRVNLTLLERASGRISRILEPGETVKASALKEFNALFAKELKTANAVVFAGSLPPGMPLSSYARLIRLARARHVLTALDASGEALRLGIKAGPFIVKPNQEEAEALLGRKIVSMKDVPAALKDLKAMCGTGTRIILLSLAEEGLAGFDGMRILVAQPPVRLGLAVGCGDASLAGFLAAFLGGKSFDVCLRQGAASGAANVGADMPGAIRRGQVARIIKSTRVTGHQ